MIDYLKAKISKLSHCSQSSLIAQQDLNYAKLQKSVNDTHEQFCALRNEDATFYVNAINRLENDVLALKKQVAALKPKRIRKKKDVAHE